MTIRELAQNWIDNADTSPVQPITTETAAEYIGWMDPDTLDITDDIPLTPETFAAAWNSIIES